jgi:outer membrane immunogenic protein
VPNSNSALLKSYSFLFYLRYSFLNDFFGRGARSMKKVKQVLYGLAACVSAAVPAFAADMPVKAPPYAPIVDPWSGFYFGGNFGYSSGRVANSDTRQILTGANAGLLDTGNGERSLTGVIGGGQIGWNWNLAPNWIWGIETDFQWSGQKNSSETVTGNTVAGTVLTTTTTSSQRLDWFGTARLRLGWVVGNTLLYGTGGYAYGKVEGSDAQNRVPGIAGNASFVGLGTTTATKSGWAAGLGAETKLGGNWSARLEYLYVDLGTFVNGYTTVLTSGALAGTPAQIFANTLRFQDHIFRVGLNYKL